MAKTKISEYSATAADNTDISNINIAEGCSPANVNNAIRTLMAQLKDQQAGTNGDPFTVGGNLSVTGTSALTGNVTASGTLTVSGATALNGNNTLGDNTADTLTINSSAVTTPNGLNFDSNTLVIDATNNRVGIAKASPTTALDVTGTVTATAFAGALTGNVTGNVTGNLTGNADTVTNGVYTTNFTSSNQSLTTDGYQKLPGGLIMQWGSVSITAGNVVTSVTFPIAFPNAALNAQITHIDTSTTDLVVYKVNDISTTTLGIRNTTGVSTYAYWFAIGY
jgi:hypothetical protein